MLSCYFFYLQKLWRPSPRWGQNNGLKCCVLPDPWIRPGADWGWLSELLTFSVNLTKNSRKIHHIFLRLERRKLHHLQAIFFLTGPVWWYFLYEWPVDWLPKKVATFHGWATHRIGFHRQPFFERITPRLLQQLLPHLKGGVFDVVWFRFERTRNCCWWRVFRSNSIEILQEGTTMYGEGVWHLDLSDSSKRYHAQAVYMYLYTVYICLCSYLDRPVR